MVLNELHGGREVGLVELVRNVPADRAELAPLLDRRVQERDGVEQRLPLRHRHDVDQVLQLIDMTSMRSWLMKPYVRFRPAFTPCGASAVYLIDVCIIYNMRSPKILGAR